MKTFLLPLIFILGTPSSLLWSDVYNPEEEIKALKKEKRITPAQQASAPKKLLRPTQWQGSVITDPLITKRCEKLLESRQWHLQQKNKLAELIARNLDLQKSVPRNRKTLQEQIDRTFRDLKKEMRLKKIKLYNIEEKIIRSGCPSIQPQ